MSISVPRSWLSFPGLGSPSVVLLRHGDRSRWLYPRLGVCKIISSGSCLCIEEEWRHSLKAAFSLGYPRCLIFALIIMCNVMFWFFCITIFLIFFFCITIFLVYLLFIHLSISLIFIHFAIHLFIIHLQFWLFLDEAANNDMQSKYYFNFWGGSYSKVDSLLKSIYIGKFSHSSRSSSVI